VGTIFENLDVKIINEKDGIGEIVAKGDAVFLGYINNEKLTKEAFTEDGYFITGDIGYIKNNKLYLTGRKETILVGDNGENIFPKEIENKLKELSNNILKVKSKLIDNKLTCDIYVLDTNLDTSSIIDTYNKQVTKKDIIKEYIIHDKKELSFKE
jgi:long-subunit acyl-CoA synthetase (AMP-forming)